MDYYYQLCNNILCQIDDYYKAVGYLEQTIYTSSTNLYTYFDEMPKTGYGNDCKVGTMKVTDIVYDGVNISKSKINNDYLECLRKYSLYDLRRILYVALSVLTPKIMIGMRHGASGSHSAEIVAPYEAINGAIRLIEFDMKTMGNDELSNNIDMVNKYNKLEYQYKELKEKYDKIKEFMAQIKLDTNIMFQLTIFFNEFV